MIRMYSIQTHLAFVDIFQDWLIMLLITLRLAAIDIIDTVTADVVSLPETMVGRRN